MSEFRCGTCGWTARALHPEGIVQAEKDHRRDGCATNQQVPGGAS